jgi:hypothetical protein
MSTQPRSKNKSIEKLVDLQMPRDLLDELVQNLRYDRSTLELEFNWPEEMLEQLLEVLQDARGESTV